MAYPTPFGDYDEMYGSLDYTGKTVLDIGADYGTTAEYFLLERGAMMVFVSERNEEWVMKLHEMAAENPRVKVLPPMTVELLTSWLIEHVPHIVKVDCEGCEQALLNIAPALLHYAQAWVIETHTRMLLNELRERFRLLGFRIETIEDFGSMTTNPDKHVAVFTAVRRPA